MRITRPLASLGLVATIVLASCSVEKRVHQPGYHVEWHTAQKKVKPVPAEKVEHMAIEEQTAEVTPIEQVVTAPEQAPVEAPAAMDNAMAATESPIGEVKSATEVMQEKVKAEQAQQEMINAIPEVSEKAAKKASVKEVKKQVKAAIDSSDAPKWLKLWLITWGVALILTILGAALISPGILIVAWVAWLVGTVFGILWLVAVLS